MLDFSSLPLWATVIKRVLTVLIMLAFGLHSYVQYRRRGGQTPAPERWVFFVFSIAMLFGVVVNIDMLVMAAKLDVKQGPYNTGVFSLLVFMLYVVFAGGIGRRKRLSIR